MFRNQLTMGSVSSEETVIDKSEVVGVDEASKIMKKGRQVWWGSEESDPELDIYGSEGGDKEDDDGTLVGSDHTININDEDLKDEDGDEEGDEEETSEEESEECSDEDRRLYEHVGGDIIHIYYEGRTEDKAESIIISIRDDEELAFRCVLDPEKCLHGSNIWKVNGSLLEGHSKILMKCVLKYLDNFIYSPAKLNTADDVFFTVDLTFWDNMIMDDDGEYPTIFFPLFPTESHEKMFEDILKKVAKPVLKQNGKLNDCHLVLLHESGFVEVASENSLYLKIKKVLKKNASQIQEPDEEYVYEKYAKYIDEDRGKNFIARLDGKPKPLYRVRIQEEITKEVGLFEDPPTLYEREFRVSYIDLGLERDLTVRDFVCMGNNPNLPPLLHQLPPQVVKCYPKQMCPNALTAVVKGEFKLQGDAPVSVIAEGVRDSRFSELFAFIYPRVANTEEIENVKSYNHKWHKLYRAKLRKERLEEPYMDAQAIAAYYLNQIRAENELNIDPHIVREFRRREQEGIDIIGDIED